MTNIINLDEKHIACVLLVDTSDERLTEELNKGLHVFREALMEDAVAAGCTDICVISFDKEVKVVVPFVGAEEAVIPALYTSSCNERAMNQAILAGLEQIEARKREYKAIGVDYWKPQVLLLTGGDPTDDQYAADAKECLQEVFNMKKICFLPVGYGEGANTAVLKSYTKDG